MLGEKLLDRFSEYDLKEVEYTFSNLVKLCSELHKAELGDRRIDSKAKWKELFKTSEDLDYIFFED